MDAPYTPSLTATTCSSSQSNSSFTASSWRSPSEESIWRESSANHIRFLVKDIDGHRVSESSIFSPKPLFRSTIVNSVGNGEIFDATVVGKTTLSPHARLFETGGKDVGEDAAFTFVAPGIRESGTDGGVGAFTRLKPRSLSKMARKEMKHGKVRWSKERRT